MPELERKLKEAQATEQKKSADKGRPQLLRTMVGAEEIAEVVARATGIPVSKLMQGERDKLLQMEARLHERVVGQDEAIARGRQRDPPLTLGPVGSEPADRLVPVPRARPASARPSSARRSPAFLFDSEDHLIRLDMSEFMEKHSVARMIGAPPGYVGYDEGGYLTEAVRRKPYCVLLLDEVEKAHPDVFNVLLQVLDDGRLTDGQGRTVDFKNTVIVMTSNLGSQQIMQMAGQSARGDQRRGLGRGQEALPAGVPEPHRRGRRLPRARRRRTSQAIAKIQLKVLEARLEKMDMKLEVSSRALAQLAKAGFDPVFGARPLKRAIQREIENPVAKLILEGRFGPKDVIPVDFEDGRFVFERVVH